MNLSPTARGVIGALAVAVATTSTALAALDQVPPWVGIILTVASSTLNFLLAPPQLGGTQQGIANPTLTEPPAVDTEPNAGRVRL